MQSTSQNPMTEWDPTMRATARRGWAPSGDASRSDEAPERRERAQAAVEVEPPTISKTTSTDAPPFASRSRWQSSA